MEAIDNILTIDQSPIINTSIRKENLINIDPVIESVRDPGRASLMKGGLGYSSNLSKQNTFGWLLDSRIQPNTK
uniref:Plug domain-containing protein n=1 Tax=Heterorhabditis bacteriophora TaxID=37862 RepID=A0A1I7W6I8_HETBA